MTRGLRIGACALAVVAVVCIGWVDHLTGADVGLSLFYLLPIAAAGLWLGATPAAICGVVASLTWFAADSASTSASAWVSTWNGLTRLVIFVAIGVGIAVLRDDRVRLRRLLDASEAAARTDPVTGLANLRAFAEEAARHLSQARRELHRFSVAYIDLDDFKKVNDCFGHAAGNALLAEIGKTLRDAVREGDVAARVGGDEFALLLWGADADTGRRIAARIVERIGDMRGAYPGARFGASAGVVGFESPPANADALLRAADEAMYEAKALGKGTVVARVCSQTPVPSESR